MNQSRKAIFISIIYSLPLLIWFTARLQLLQWTPVNLHTLFQQTFFIILLLQCFSLSLLYINQAKISWQDDIMAGSHILLFPLPFISLCWLTGSITLLLIMKSLALLCLMAVFIIMGHQYSQRLSRKMPDQENFIALIFVSFLFLPVIFIWNFRDIWRNWLNL